MGRTMANLTFVSGSPGKTDRQLTLDELADMRDRYLPVPPAACFIVAKCCESPSARVRSKTQEERATICLAIKTTANATTVIWPALLDPQIWSRDGSARGKTA